MSSEPSARTERGARTTQRVVALITFAVVAAAFAIVFGMLFDSYLLGIGPALVLAAAVTGGTAFARRRR